MNETATIRTFILRRLCAFVKIAAIFIPLIITFRMEDVEAFSNYS